MELSKARDDAVDLGDDESVVPEACEPPFDGLGVRRVAQLSEQTRQRRRVRRHGVTNQAGRARRPVPTVED